MEKIQNRASMLLEALPYIQRFHGKTIVVKIGGAVLESEDLLNSLLKDVVLLNYVGMRIAIVHGGGREVSEEMRRMGKEPKFIEGLRVTDEETMEVLYKLLAGKLNKEIVLKVNRHGGRAVGISGIDGNFIRARKVLHRTAEAGREVDLGLVGEVEAIDPTVIDYLVGTGYIPVIAPVGADAEGRSLNINADAVAAELAIAMRAKKLVALTDVPGVLADPKDERSLISRLTVGGAQRLIDEGTIGGGMIPKVEACIRAVKGGVERAHIINGRIPHSILLEILTERGIGTMIERD